MYDGDGLLTNETSTNGTSAVFTYDTYDRPATARENAPDGKWLQKTFVYAGGNISGVQYTSQNGSIATENFVYANGHNTEIKLNGTITLWKLTEENALGQPTKATTGTMNRTYSYTAYGMPTGRTAGTIQNFTYDFDVLKGNLNSRKDNIRNITETFGYDNLNRLSSIGAQQITYTANGNITQMPGVGTMEYENSAKPYQVTMLTPTGTAVPVREQSLTYTSFQRPATLAENGYSTSFTYNAAGDRVKMHLTQGSTAVLTRYYIGRQYELDAQTNVERLYLGGDVYSAPSVYVKEAGNWNIYYICRDYLGSITHVANANGSLKAEYSYDAWGRLRNPATQVAYAPGSEPVLFLGRGYTGHEHLSWFGLVNMNARLYDAALGRFLSPDPYVQMPDFSQNFNRYSYALNNPLLYYDKDGEIIGTIFGAISDLFNNVFIRTFKGDKWDWTQTKLGWEIDKGLFKGDFKQILSRFTWELPQTILGYTASTIHNTFGGVKSVTHYDGATAVESYSENWGAFTLGSYIIGHRGLQADPDNSLFQHEYGHYLQSQSSGLFYLQRYALPSLIDAMGDSNHKYHAVEQDANIRAYKYFMKNIDGFNVMDVKTKTYFNGQWYSSSNPIKEYNWSLDYNNAANQLALKKGLVRPKWWDYVLGPTVIIPGIINVLNLKQ